MGLEHIHSEPQRRGHNAGLHSAVVDAWSQTDRGTIVSTAQRVFNAEVDSQIKESMKALFVTGPKRAVQNLSDQARYAGEVLSVVPDDFQILCESIYDQPRAEVNADKLGVRLRKIGSGAQTVMKAAGQAYAPIETDLEQIGAIGNYARLIEDPVKAAGKAWSDFTNQSAPKQVEDISSGLIDTAITCGANKVLEGFDMIAAQQLLSRAEQHIQRLDGLINAASPVTPEGGAFRKYVFAGEKAQLSEPKAAERLTVSPKWLAECTNKELHVLELERLEEEYRKIFFQGHPELMPFENEIVVHHAIEQQVLSRYPGIFTANELNSLDNLRGIPKSIERKLHRQEIRSEWDDFYALNPMGCAPKEELRRRFFQKAHEIDRVYGEQFEPPVKESR